MIEIVFNCIGLSDLSELKTFQNKLAEESIVGLSSNWNDIRPQVHHRHLYPRIFRPILRISFQKDDSSISLNTILSVGFFYQSHRGHLGPSHYFNRLSHSSMALFKKKQVLNSRGRCLSSVSPPTWSTRTLKWLLCNYSYQIKKFVRC